VPAEESDFRESVLETMKSVVVLGGGLSGLAISRHLALKNNFKVACVEQASRVGGWVTSTRVDDGVLFEQGPHSLRPRARGNGLRAVELIRELGLEEEGSYAAANT
jgi:oxygen-dependent protoporphyrinogen oxidase